MSKTQPNETHTTWRTFVSYFLFHITLTVISAAISRPQSLGTGQERTFRGPEERHAFLQ
jgi:hypothetical protein